MNGPILKHLLKFALKMNRFSQCFNATFHNGCFAIGFSEFWSFIVPEILKSALKVRGHWPNFSMYISREWRGLVQSFSRYCGPLICGQLGS
jgi:hypothetical protein